METSSTYRYGEGCFSGLNRTMQYGNYTYFFFVTHIFFKFKSYYVVWKLTKLPYTRPYPTRFKSYYVVWKLLLRPPDETSPGTFKSYYIVWKLYFITYAKISTPRLNRTMQYGNFFLLVQSSFSTIEFKSYYVVWKRNRSRHSTCTLRGFKSYYVVWKQNIGFEKYCDFSSLNRTMQYGNFFFLIVAVKSI